MELGHLLTRSGLTYPEVSLKVFHDSVCQLGSSVSLLWVNYFEAFYLHVVFSVSCIPAICPKLVLFLALFKFFKARLLNDESIRRLYTQRVKLHLSNKKKDEIDIEKERKKLTKHIKISSK